MRKIWFGLVAMMLLLNQSTVFALEEIEQTPEQKQQVLGEQIQQRFNVERTRSQQVVQGFVSQRDTNFELKKQARQNEMDQWHNKLADKYEKLDQEFALREVAFQKEKQVILEKEKQIDGWVSQLSAKFDEFIAYFKNLDIATLLGFGV